MPPELILTATVLKGHRIEVSDPSLVEGKVVRVTIADPGATPSVNCGHEIVEYWRKEGVLGSKADIEDSAAHARKVRERAEKRVR